MTTTLTSRSATTPKSASTQIRTVADLVRALGDIDLARIRLRPAVGTATEQDLLGEETSGCELVDESLVEKARGFFERYIGSLLHGYLFIWLTQHDLGVALADGALIRLADGIVRVPDVCFIRWDRIGSKQVPRQPISDIVPNLAVEVLSEGNTAAEIERKRHEYFAAGVELVWIVSPRQRTVEVWSTDRDCRILTAEETLTGGTVLPGFELRISDWFQRAESGDGQGESHD